MDFKSFDDPQPVAPTDSARQKIRAHGRRIRARRRTVMSTPLVLVAAAAVAIPIVVSTSNNRSDIQRIDPITSPTPSGPPTEPSFPPTDTPISPSLAVTASLESGAGPDLGPHPFTTTDGTTLYPLGIDGNGDGTANYAWRIAAGPNGFALKVADFSGTFNGQPACQAEPPEALPADKLLTPGEQVAFHVRCREGSGTLTMKYAPEGTPLATWASAS